ncbi:MAG TPA: hypothetical protein ENI05_07565 [Porticoccus sp.]|nr:hypothetical protein [Porticoccus sp.]
MIEFSREWAWSTHETFSCPPIGRFVERHLVRDAISVDCFARNNRLATFTNDLNPETAAEYHMDVEAFLAMLKEEGVMAETKILAQESMRLV